MTALCLDCGFCCDGTMFSTVAIADESESESESESEMLQAAGFHLLIHDSGSRFEQPCGAFQSQCCSIYDRVPAMCNNYRCALLSKHDTGEVSTAEALEHIAHTRAARDKVYPALHLLVGADTPLPLQSLIKLMNDLLAGLDDDTRQRRHGQLLVDVDALRALLVEHFEVPNPLS